MLKNVCNYLQQLNEEEEQFVYNNCIRQRINELIY